MSSPTSPAHIGGTAWAHGGCSQAHTAVQPLADGVAASSAVPVKKSDALEVLAVPSVRLWRLPSSLKDSAGKAPRSVAPSSSPLANTWMSPANSTRHRTTAKLGYCAEASLATAALRMPSETAPGRRTLAPVALKERLYPRSPPCPKTDCPAPEQSTHLHARTCAQGLDTRVASPDAWGCSLWPMGLQRLACRVAARDRAVGAHAARRGGGVELGARQRRRPRRLQHRPELHAGRVARAAVHGRGGLQASRHRRTRCAVRALGAKAHRRAPALGRVPLERRPPGTVGAQCEVVARRAPAMSEHGWSRGRGLQDRVTIKVTLRLRVGLEVGGSRSGREGSDLKLAAAAGRAVWHSAWRLRPDACALPARRADPLSGGRAPPVRRALTRCSSRTWCPSSGRARRS